jgi:DnaK suppressor protein
VEKKAVNKPVKKPKVNLEPKPQKAKRANVGLTKAREEGLRLVLLAKKQEVWKDVKERLFTRMGREYHEETDDTLDDGDKAMVDLAAETGLSLIDMGTDVLEKIDRALAKLDEGSYGICEDCGEEINENRLKVVPFAIYCIECKSKREQMESIAREPDRFAHPEHEEIVD